MKVKCRKRRKENMNKLNFFLSLSLFLSFFQSSNRMRTWRVVAAHKRALPRSIWAVRAVCRNRRARSENKNQPKNETSVKGQTLSRERLSLIFSRNRKPLKVYWRSSVLTKRLIVLTVVLLIVFVKWLWIFLNHLCNLLTNCADFCAFEA